ncbi:MAG: DUF4384 domain-containing protein [Myxococcaceae bacterium]|nr:DUF4384 domain-containing protein [Myxococcaceae bacterium]
MSPITAEALETGIARYFAARAPQPCARDVELARHLANELSAAEAADFAQHVARCADCAATLDDVTDTRGVWAAPAAAVLAFPRRVRLFVAPALALAAALLAFVATWLVPAPASDRLVPKGVASWSLDLAVQRGGQQFLAPSGARLQKGDQLGFFYSSDRDGYLTVFYADAVGAPVRIFPARGDASAKIAAGEKVRLSDGAVLDDGSGCEWAIGVFTPAPLSGEKARELVSAMLGGRQGCTLGAAPKGSLAVVNVVVVNR